jgi:hypothetical protein
MGSRVGMFGSNIGDGLSFISEKRRKNLGHNFYTQSFALFLKEVIFHRLKGFSLSFRKIFLDDRCSISC